MQALYSERSPVVILSPSVLLRMNSAENLARANDLRDAGFPPPSISLPPGEGVQKSPSGREPALSEAEGARGEGETSRPLTASLLGNLEVGV